MFIFFCIKSYFQFKMIAAPAFELPSKMGMVLMESFFKQDLIIFIKVGNATVISLDLCPDLAVYYDCF